MYDPSEKTKNLLYVSRRLASHMVIQLSFNVEVSCI